MPDRAYVPELDELLGDTSQFFDRHFNKAPMLRRSAFARPQDVLSIADLDEALSTRSIRGPYLDIIQDGVPVSRSKYTEAVTVRGEYLTDCIVAIRAADYFRSGSTLVFNALNHYRPNVRLLTQRLSLMFASACHAAAFLTPAGKRGLKPHYDAMDVFVLQVAGTKTWHVWRPQELRRGGERDDLSETELGDPAVACTLEPGDVLYLPYNSTHAAAAQQELSLHVTVTVMPRRWADLLEATVRRLMADDPAFWAYPWLRGPDAASELQAAIEALRAGLSALNADTEIGQLIGEGTSYQQANGRHCLRDVAFAGAMLPDTLLTSSDASVSVVGDAGGSSRIDVNGQRYTVPAAAVSALSALHDGRAAPAGALVSGLPQDASMRLARSLVSIGVLRQANGTVH